MPHRTLSLASPHQQRVLFDAKSARVTIVTVYQTNSKHTQPTRARRRIIVSRLLTTYVHSITYIQEQDFTFFHWQRCCLFHGQIHT